MFFCDFMEVAFRGGYSKQNKVNKKVIFLKLIKWLKQKTHYLRVIILGLRKTSKVCWKILKVSNREQLFQ